MPTASDGSQPQADMALARGSCHPCAMRLNAITPRAGSASRQLEVCRLCQGRRAGTSVFENVDIKLLSCSRSRVAVAQFFVRRAKVSEQSET